MELEHRGNTEEDRSDLSETIIGAALRVHSGLGPGLLESAYETCLCYELSRAGVRFKRQVPIALQYEQVTLDCGFRLDLLVEDRVIVEVKSVERMVSLHECQLLTYLRVSRLRVGLLLNFNVSHMRNGIRRMVF